ncbi:MAG: hypothetical protein M3Q78_00095 [Acidobacteriota bacterium]|nr:hypothetical protein [Acidobacteriota bacterium]
MKIPRHKVISLVLLFAILVAVPQTFFAQTRLLGELTTKSTSGSENFIVVNGENVSGGRSILSPASIVTPSKTTAELFLPKTGIVKIAEGSTLNLFFENANITGDFWTGKLTFDVLPNTKFNILTADGNVSNSSLDRQTVATIDILNGKVRVQTLAGEVSFNEVKVAEGQTYLAQSRIAPVKVAEKKSGSGKKKFFLITLAVAGAFAVGALVGRSGNDD